MTYSPHKLTKSAIWVGTLAAFCATSTLNAQSVFFEDFEDTDMGNPIYTNSGGSYDVDRRSAGINPFPSAALRIRDRVTNRAPIIEWELGSAISAAKFSYDFTAFAADNTTGPIRFGVGLKTGTTSQELNQGANRYITIVLDSSGSIDFQTSGGTDFSDTYTTDALHSLTFFINDFDGQSINYTAPGGSSETLLANNVAYYLNDSLLGTTSLIGTVGGRDLTTTEGNIGRFGFHGLSGGEGIVSHYDNISVSAIPEPSTYSLIFGALALSFAATRRRQN
jgi:hypothetical protein